MFNRWHRALDESADLELIPVMNLFMVLIPFLLMGAAFYHVGAISTSLPTHTPDDSDVPKTPATVTVNLVIAPAELQMTASSTSLDDEQLQALGASWSKKDGKHDTRALQNQLRTIKERYPQSNTLIVLPHPDLDYQSLVGVLDAAREYKAEPDAKGDPKFADLFPVVVFSKFITAGEAEVSEAPAMPEAP